MSVAKKINREKEYFYKDYKNWNDNEDWEIIDGRAYNMSPSPTRKHQEIGSKIHLELGQYLKEKSCSVYYELDVVLSEKDVVKPDILVVCDENKMKEKNIKGAPDLVVEILSPSTARKDRYEKFKLYKRSKVREYWIVDPYNLSIEVYDFENDERYVYAYDEMIEDEKEKTNLMEVRIFDGDLKLDVNYILK